MKLIRILKLFSFRDLRNGLLGLIVVLSGLGLAGLTLWAHSMGNTRMAGITAGISLIFVLVILIFVIPPLARSASAEASQMDLPFEFTPGGGILLGLLVIVGFAAWNTGNNLLFLVLSFMASALVVGFAVGSSCLKKLDIKMRFPETIFAGETTPLIVSLHNKKVLFPTFSVVAEVRGKEREKSRLIDELKGLIPLKIAERVVRPPLIKHTLDYFAFVPRRKSMENRAEHVFKNRGRFIIKDFELSTRFPFGFFRHRRRLSAQEAELIVYPKIEPVDITMLQIPFEVGKLVSRKRGAGQDLLSLRDYQPQDDLRHVDWKSTARARRLIVREFAAEDELRVTVVFDGILEMTEESRNATLKQRLDDEQKGRRDSDEARRFEKGVSQAASILSYFAGEQAEIRLIANGETGEFGIGKVHLHGCLRQLALLEPMYYEGNGGRLTTNLIDEIVNGTENSYTFVITAGKEMEWPEEVARQAKILEY